MSTPRDRQWLLESHLEDLNRRHQANQDWWRALDAKAQGNITGCGILLAGTFVVFQSVIKCTTPVQTFLLLAALWALLLSMGASVLALLVRSTKTPPSVRDAGNTLQQLEASLEDEAGKVSERIANFVRDQFEPFETSIADDVRNALRKAARLRSSQLILLSGLALLAVLATLRVLTPPCPSVTLAPGTAKCEESRRQPVRPDASCTCSCGNATSAETPSSAPPSLSGDAESPPEQYPAPSTPAGSAPAEGGNNE